MYDIRLGRKYICCLPFPTSACGSISLNSTMANHMATGSCLQPHYQVASVCLILVFLALLYAFLRTRRLTIARNRPPILPSIEGYEKLSPAPETASTISTPAHSHDWTPPHYYEANNYLATLVEEADANPKPLNRVLQELKELIEGDTILFMLFFLMFSEVPPKPPYNRDPTGRRQLRDYNHMLQVFNIIMTRGPPWMYSTEGQKGLVGFPLSAVL